MLASPRRGAWERRGPASRIRALMRGSAFGGAGVDVDAEAASVGVSSPWPGADMVASVSLFPIVGFYSLLDRAERGSRKQDGGYGCGCGCGQGFDGSSNREGKAPVPELRPKDCGNRRPGHSRQKQGYGGLTKRERETDPFEIHHSQRWRQSRRSEHWVRKLR